MQPYHTELAAGTMNPATFLRCLGGRPWKTAYVEPVIRPTDGRYGENPYRFQHYFQYQVILKPAPADVLDVYFRSLEAIGIDLRRHDIRLVEDDWEQPTLGAWGLGWEVWCDGMEITQWTYFQQLGGFDVELVPAVVRADHRLDVRRLPPARAEAAQERRRVHRPRRELGVVRLHQDTAVVRPVALEGADRVLVGRNGQAAQS